MANENATKEKKVNFEDFDFDDLERKLDEEYEADLEKQLEEKLAELEFIDDQKEKIGNPDELGKVVLNTVWEQFTNQIAIQAGEDFIKDNGGLNLDLRDEAHIQTTDNFAKGKIASHNTEIDYQKRYDDWQNNFQRNEDGTIKTKQDYRTKEERAVLRTKNKKSDPNGENYNTNYDAREFIDKGRPKGSKTVNKDHTISAAEIIRDPEAAAHMTGDEQAAFANSDVNLVDLDSAANKSKGDSSMTEFLDSERTGKGAGQTQAEYFGLDEEELRERDRKAREEYEKQKKEAEERSIKAGKKSQKAEALRVGKKAARAVVMNLLAELVKKIIQKFISWLKSSEKNLRTLIGAIKDAIVGFVLDLKTQVVSVLDTAVTVIMSSILGPIVNTIKKAWMLIKQGWKSLKEAIDYIRDPKNKNQPIGITMLKVGEIVVAGLTAVGAITLGEVIEKGLETIPIFKFEIPLFGSLANIIGIFMGAVVSGIIGALAIDIINRMIAKKQKQELSKEKIDKVNEVLATQEQIFDIKVDKYKSDKADSVDSIKKRHEEAGAEMRKSLNTIVSNEVESNDKAYKDLDRRLNGLLKED